MATIVPFIGFEAARKPALLSRSFRPLAAVISALLWLPRFWKARGELAALAAMSEYERRDVGLTAFDVANALALPVDRDPTGTLAKIVDDRRRHREC
jgi:hypothetical protein